ncbi:MAG: hypothetical protein JWO58_1637 [Chitinophagaceae bacterium]|nr:hypothetical protein [Chitinophagaceae bacterium]
MTLERFRELFWDAFHRPKLLTSSIQETWKSLEAINDLLSGPLYAIYEKGNCDYVFLNNEPFEGISSPDDLMDWFQDLLRQYAEGLQAATPPASSEETKDLQLLDYQLDIKADLCEMAYELCVARLGTH